MYNYPCKGCQDRYIGCHSDCEKYISARVEHTGITEKARAVRYAELDAEIYRRNGCERRRKRARLSV